MQMTMTTTAKEVAACLERGVWYELVDPRTGRFYGRWLEASGEIEEYRYRHLMRTDVALQVCQVTRVSPKDQLPLRVRVKNLERPGWRSPAWPTMGS